MLKDTTKPTCIGKQVFLLSCDLDSGYVKKVKIETLVHGSSRPARMAVICLPLCLDLDVDLDVDVDHFSPGKLASVFYPLPERVR